MCGLQMMRIYLNFAGINKGGMTKKAKRSSITEANNKKSNNKNPSFELKLTQFYAQGKLFVSLLLKMSTILVLINISNKP